MLYSITSYFPNFKHNDLKPNNILVQKIPDEYLFFKVKDNTYKFKSYGFILKMWDFDFASIQDKLENIKCK